jgi:aminoglycoside phosphotransferase family enzyme
MVPSPLNASAIDGPGLEAKVSFLKTPAAHGATTRAVQAIETHMSWVFLTERHALKLKKPVRFPFLDFSTVEARARFCAEEVRLNRRLAPGVYLGVRALRWDGGTFSLATPDSPSDSAATVDWLVLMRRLPEPRMLDRLIGEGRVSDAEVGALVDALARFYRSALRLPMRGDEYAGHWQREQASNREVLLRPQFRLQHVEQALDRLDRALARHAELLYERCLHGRIVEGHGDLRPEHVCLTDPPVVIDCVEFNLALRRVDPFDEVAFLGLECRLAGAPWIGPRLVSGLSAELDERPPAALIHLYTAQRALLRARLAMAHLLDPAPRTPDRWAPLAQRYVAHALGALDDLEGWCPLSDAPALATG